MSQEIKEQNQPNVIEHKGVKVGYNPALEGKITQEMLDAAILQLEKAQEQPQTLNEIEGRVAMRPLQSTEIFAVYSDFVGLEYTNGNRTSFDHGGNSMWVYTATAGYSSRYAKLNGKQVYTSNYEISDGDIYIDYWNLSGAQSGRFTIEALGFGRTLSDSIFIV